MNWFNSTNAKEIGTIYLIFAVFAGMIGTAFSVLVRRCALFMFVEKFHQRSSKTLTAPSLTRGESSLVNLACLSKAVKILKRISIHPQAVIPMMKVALLEVHPESTSWEGSAGIRHSRNTLSTYLLIRHVDGSIVTQTTRSSKMESGTSKGIVCINRELRDYLRAVAPSKAYGNGGSIVGIFPKGARMYSCGQIQKGSGIRPTVVPIQVEKNNLPNKYIKLVNICAKRTKDFKINDIFGLMCNSRMFEIAYHNLKSKPGNMTPGINPTTLDGVSMEVFQEIIKSLQDGSFQFSPGRRVNIPKANGGTRSLTVAPPRDKIVQEIMRMILEAIFEPMFSPNSHGFRPMRSCHTALKKIKTHFGSASFFIEGDISKCFDSFDHQILINLVKERISDEKFIQLLWKALKAGYLEFHDIQHSIVGTPQGSIVSPILANIYLHKFDEYVSDMKSNFDKGTTVQRNPIYRKYESLRTKAIRRKNYLEAKKQLKNMQSVRSRLPNDPKFRRLNYVRYADDWIIAVRGSLGETNQILEKIRIFLSEELKLNLNSTKTLITKPTKSPALFLGTLISISEHVHFYSGNHGQRLKAVSQIILNAPLDRIFKKLASASFMDLGTKVGTPRFLWYAESKDSIIKLYNSVLRGYLNYYSFANNYSRVATSLEWILKTSCLKLLAAKFKLRTTSKVLRKFGKDIKGNDNIAFIKPSYRINVWDFKINVSSLIKTLFASGISAASLDNLICLKCGSNTQVEMHHIRKLKDLNPKLSEIDRIMAKRRRKQIPLCRKCHLDHHVKHSSWTKTN